MAALDFDLAGTRLYETGIKKVALYVADASATTTNKFKLGVAWNGVSALTESPSGADANAIYADDIKYLNLIANETFGATIEAYSSPEAFDICDGTVAIGTDTGTPPTTALGLAKIGQQTRKRFCLVYETTGGTDEAAYGNHVKLHFIYNCMAAPSERSYSTVNDSPEAASLSWEISTVPMAAFNLQDTRSSTDDVDYTNVCTLTLDKALLLEEGITTVNWGILENYLFGKDETTEGAGDGVDPQILMPNQVYKVLLTGSK